MILYPKNYVVVETAVAAPVKDSAVINAAIKVMAAVEPKQYEEIIKTIQASEAAAGRYWTNDDILAEIEKVRAEWHSEESVVDLELVKGKVIP